MRYLTTRKSLVPSSYLRYKMAQDGYQNSRTKNEDNVCRSPKRYRARNASSQANPQVRVPIQASQKGLTRKTGSCIRPEEKGHFRARMLLARAQMPQRQSTQKSVGLLETENRVEYCQRQKKYRITGGFGMANSCYLAMRNEILRRAGVEDSKIPRRFLHPQI